MSMETKKPPQNADGTEKSGYEKRDANLPVLLKMGIGLAVLIVVAFVSMKFTLDYFQKVQPLGAPSSPLESGRALPPGPRLQALPHQELSDYCRVQQENVTSYRWVDEQNGVVQIPVDRAMELVLEQGLPVRAMSAAPPGSAGIHQVGTVDSPLPAGVEGPCGYLVESEREAAPAAAEPKE
jgi:hypothetical protein